ncbi:MAG TPA: alpha/beta fold hydrolase [Polyangiaceae bacterium]
MKETCCQFGPGRALAGVVTEPAASTPRGTVALVSAGVTPKFGPFRLYTELARQLADRGFRVLRFDLGGIGDSSQAFDGQPLEQRTELQVAAALDYLAERFRCDRVVLAGLCSGADDSFRYAAGDARVSGVVMVDPFAYRTRGFGWRHVRYRATRRLLRAVGLYRPLPKGGPSLVDYQHLSQSEASRLLQLLLARKVRVHFVYTAGMSERFNHERQLQTMFPDVQFDGLIEVDHLPDIDHTQFLEVDRRKLVRIISQRIAEWHPVRDRSAINTGSYRNDCRT